MRRNKTLALVVAGSLSMICNGGAQGFVNLDFESANLTPIPQGQVGSMVPITSGLPGWIGFLGSSQATQVFQNNESTGSASIDILGPNFGGGLGGIIEGNYTAVLQAGGSDVHVAATIEQSGMVPNGTRSLQVKLGTGATGFEITLGGQDISMVPLGSGVNYTLYGGNLPPSLVGQMEELSLNALPTAENPFNGFSLDSIVFSPSIVPEPATWALLLCSAGLLSVTQKFRKQ